ncbi:Glycosyltransferase sugar-binding region containing DXD motif-containing protein [Proteiniborus ethanoligenes]|uniref:Glycosyltransferase sugar-binding region containing DXD motif-containing protein n=1 Tax=Proteiniborus ethanoligenes TaxID=415015 RepID=A0A1H3QXW2_9FIRM|nr:glycosyltransferase [Proteiniborus ethanoligenes]SDZ17559.1 Glycosyltransferase sugar-binding region containing DXD motif-containing protein [Proteiniborus ethanoligenes]
MIPKILHYCWFGKGEKSSLISKCISSWRQHCPDYEIIEWNEDNFDININRFVKEAHESKKYAFVSDYVRLYVLYKHGGVYVDCDLEITQNIDVFLNDSAFSSFETKDYFPTAIMGAEKGHLWIKDLLDYYENRPFILDNNILDITTNTVIITNITKEKYGLILDNQEQILREDVHVYPNYYFCTNSYYKKNYAIHHFNGSWLQDRDSYNSELTKFKKNYNILTNVLQRISTKKELYFNFSNYEKIYLFGTGEISKYIVEYFTDMQYTIDGIISRQDKEYIFDVKNYIIDNLKNLTKNDLIIIVPSYDFENICNELSTKTKAHMISIEHILDIMII